MLSSTNLVQIEIQLPQYLLKPTADPYILLVSHTLVHELFWGEKLDDFKKEISNFTSDQAFEGFDLIIGSDITYYEEGIDPLWKTIAYLLSARDPNAKFIYCAQVI